MRISALLILAGLLLFACKSESPSSPGSAGSADSTDFLKASYFYDSTVMHDSAFMYFYEATKSSKDSLLSAMAYGYMAEIQQDAGDFVGAQETAVAGIKQLKGDSGIYERYCLASLFNNLGRSNVGLKNYDEAIKYYRQAITVPTSEDNRNIYKNNIAVALREKGNYKEALDNFNSIKADANESKRAFARRTTNLASVKWKVDSKFNPLPDLHKALNIRLAEKDNYGITASYNHLSTYYKTSHTDSALHYANKMFALAQKTNASDDQLDALSKLIILSPPSESKKLFDVYQHLRDSLQISQNAAKNQFAMIRYDSEKNRNRYLTLQEENAQKEFQLLRQRVFTYGSIVVTALIVSLGIWHYRKKRQQTKLEAQATIKENQLKISQRIHDTVANGLYRIMSEIEHVEAVDKEPLLDKIEDLYERSRDLSYETAEQEQDTATRISKLITAFATSTTKISVVGNKDELWSVIPSMVVKELEQVIQELMVNMKKHSGARHVVLSFSRPDDTMLIAYKDDGYGFPSNFEKGNGLKSTGNRINEIGGEITFVTETVKGAEIKILIPILSNDQKSINS